MMEVKWWVGETVSFSVFICCFTRPRFQRSLNEVPLDNIFISVIELNVTSFWFSTSFPLTFSIFVKLQNSWSNWGFELVTFDSSETLLCSGSFTWHFMCLTWHGKRAQRKGEKKGNWNWLLRETLCRRGWKMSNQESESPLFLACCPRFFSFPLSVMTRYDTFALVRRVTNEGVLTFRCFPSKSHLTNRNASTETGGDHPIERVLWNRFISKFSLETLIHARPHS